MPSSTQVLQLEVGWCIVLMLIKDVCRAQDRSGHAELDADNTGATRRWYIVKTFSLMARPFLTTPRHCATPRSWLFATRTTPWISARLSPEQELQMLQLSGTYNDEEYLESRERERETEHRVVGLLKGPQISEMPQGAILVGTVTTRHCNLC